MAGCNITRNIKVEFALIMFNSILNYIICFKELHKNISYVFCLQLTGKETLGDHECNIWRSIVKEGGKRNVYTLWQSVATQLPIRYEMMGYDNLLGSHYDKYYIDYIDVQVQKSLDDAIFKTPAS